MLAAPTRVALLILSIPLVLNFSGVMRMGIWSDIVLAACYVNFCLFLLKDMRAHEAVVEDQRRYQATLRRASSGMGGIKDLQKLLRLIAYMLARVVKIEHVLIYVLENNQYILRAHRRRSKTGHLIKAISEAVPITKYFSRFSHPVVLSDIIRRSKKEEPSLEGVAQVLSEIKGDTLYPVFVGEKLFAVIALGRKISGLPYSEDERNVFSILANQAAMAIENARFFEDMQRTLVQLLQAEKMATIGTMADGLAHQINNRFHAVGFIVGDALDTIKIHRSIPMDERLNNVFTDLDRALLRVQDNVVQGGQIVQGILKYTRKGEEKFEDLVFDDVVDSAFQMAQFKIRMHELTVVRAYDPAQAPRLHGNFTQIQEVFFNLVDNAYDAMMQRKLEQREQGYMPTLTIDIYTKDSNIEVLFKDNGVGVKEEDLQKMFTPFFTTKIANKKGTGLGLYVIKKIIEENHRGRVEMTSTYMTGTQMKLVMPFRII